MASIRRQRTVWFACITLGNGKRTQASTGIRDKGSPRERADAEKKAREVAVAMEEASRGNRTESQIRKVITDLYARVNGKRIEFSKTDVFLNNWLTSVKVQKQPDSYERYRGVVEDFIGSLENRANVPLGDVTCDDIQSFFDSGKRDGKKAKTLNVERKVLNAAFSLALKRGLIITNPVASATIAREDGESKEPFSVDQVTAIIRAAEGDWKTVIMIGAHCGARLGDCANFKWSNFDLAKKLLVFRPNKTERHKKSISCPLHPALLAHLMALPSSDDPNAFVTPSLAGRYSGGRAGLSNKFNSILDSAGIDNPFIVTGEGKGRGFRAYGFHSFRHTFKTHLVNAGVAVETVDVLTAHAKKTVSEIYIHRSPELLAAAVAKLPNFV